LGEAGHGKAASYRSNRGFVITQSNIKRFFDVQEVNIPRSSYDQDSQSLPEGGRSVSVGRHGAINPAGAGALFQHKGLSPRPFHGGAGRTETPLLVKSCRNQTDHLAPSLPEIKKITAKIFSTHTSSNKATPETIFSQPFGGHGRSRAIANDYVHSARA
jgi:hypothetical protein